MLLLHISCYQWLLFVEDETPPVTDNCTLVVTNGYCMLRMKHPRWQTTVHTVGWCLLQLYQCSTVTCLHTCLSSIAL